MRVALSHGASAVSVFGSVARGDAGLGSDLDILVEMGDGPSLLDQAAVQSDLENLLRCPVHLVTTNGLKNARDQTREQIEREAVPL